jgi:hypothetical protein
MKLENVHPQYHDTVAGTLQRAGTDPLDQVSTTQKDSNEIAPKKTFQPLSDNSGTAHYVNNATDTLQPFNATDTLQTLKESDTLQTTMEVSPVSELPEARETEGYNRFWQSNDWMIGVLLLLLITLAWIRMNFRKLLIDNRKAAFSLRDSSRLFNEQNSLVQRVSFVLNIVFFVTLALFVYQALMVQSDQPTGSGSIVSFLVLLIAIILIYTSRVLVYKFLGYLFQYIEQSKELIHNSFVINRITAFILFPFIAIIPFIPGHYAQWCIYAGICFFGVLYALQLIRNMQLFLKNVHSVLYSILYLCALEIVPVIVLIKFLISFF